MTMTAPKKRFSIGVDYGTNSVRALIVDLVDGSEVATASYAYPSGEQGIILDKTNTLLARQNPVDYMEGFYAAVSDAVKKAKRKGFKAEQVAGIGTDATGSTPIPVDRQGLPISMDPKLKNDPAALAWLWKDHTSHEEAARITEAAEKHAHENPSENFLTKCGGIYSSEWYWSKILHCKKESPKAFRAAFSWVEQSDFGRRTYHAIAFHSPYFCDPDFHQIAFSVPADLCARTCYGDFHPFGQIASAAYDFLQVSAAGIGFTYTEFVRIGMGQYFMYDADYYMFKLSG